MPLLGTRCRWRGGLISTAECVACAETGANPCGYPLSMIRLMTKDRKPDVVGCSATMLEGCPREHGLKANVRWYTDPERTYTRAFGSLMHAGNEFIHGALAEKFSPEVRYARLFNGVKVTAQVDSIYFEDECHAIIRDLKLVPSLAPSELNRKLKHHRVQFSVQRWILAGMGIEVTSIDLDFLTHKGMRQVNLTPEGDPELPNASLLSLEETETYLGERLPNLVAALGGALPDPLSNPQDLWRCNWCDVRPECEYAWGRPIPASLPTPRSA